jgi:RHS repeat-associated protein
MGNRLEGEYAGTGALQKEYVHATNDLAADYMIAGGAEYRLIKDHLGSVRLVVNTTSGAVVERIDYNEWGKVLRDTNSCFEPFGFAGGVYDKDTGFVLFGARDYDPETGRWTSKDPILFKGGSPNLYSYVLNDPINFVDPSGKAASLSEFWNNTVDALNDLVRHLKDPPSGSRVKEVKKFCEGRMDDAFDTINNVTNDLGK